MKDTGKEVDKMANKKLFAKKKFCANKKVYMPSDEANQHFYQNAPSPYRKKMPGVDPGIYEGVRIGMEAMKARQMNAMKKGSTTECLSPERVDQRLFVLNKILDEDQARTVTVVLNGAPCKAGRDYTVSGNALNWLSQRKLYTTDTLAVRYSLVPDGLVNIGKLSAAVMKKMTVYTDPSVGKLVDGKLANLQESMAIKMAELEMAIESLDTDFKAVTFTAEVELDTEEEVTEPVQEVEEEEDVIEPGVKVYHRLSDDGPWIVVQPTVLNIKSREEGGSENAFKAGFVELAWTVQTEDGVRDFPEVVLTTRVPKKERFWTWKKVTGAVVGASVLVGGIVHAPLILSMLGIIH